MSILKKYVKVSVAALGLIMSTQTSAFVFTNALIAEGDMIKHFYQRYSGDIEAMDLVNAQGQNLYQLTVVEQTGDSWVYQYNAMSGKLVSKRAHYIAHEPAQHFAYDNPFE